VSRRPVPDAAYDDWLPEPRDGTHTVRRRAVRCVQCRAVVAAQRALDHGPREGPEVFDFQLVPQETVLRDGLRQLPAIEPRRASGLRVYGPGARGRRGQTPRALAPQRVVEIVAHVIDPPMTADGTAWAPRSGAGFTRVRASRARPTPTPRDTLPWEPGIEFLVMVELPCEVFCPNCGLRVFIRAADAG
jgi:hypothetical protein